MLYLLRHGQMDGGNENRYIGQTDKPLNHTGRSQAHQWKKGLAQVEFEAVYASNLKRAMETAGIVSGLSASQILVLPELREIDLGDWEGACMAAIRQRHPKAWEERGRRMDRFRPPGGESFQDLYDRVMPVFRKITNRMTGQVLVTAHAGVNRVILCSLLGKPLGALFDIPQEEACLNLIDNHHGRLTVIAINKMPDDIGLPT